MQKHPAFERFATRQGLRRLLLVWAPAATERHVFAGNWSASAEDCVLDLSRTAPGPELDAILNDAAAAHHRTAILLPPSAPAYRLAASYSAALAGPADLLLTVPEIARWLSSRHLPRSYAPQLFAMAGGWMEALALLAQPSPDAHGAQGLVTGALDMWLTAHDPNGLLGAAGFLDDFEPQTLKHFYAEFTTDPIGVQELAGHGLLSADINGTWRMPTVVSRALVARSKDASMQRAAEFERAALSALAEARSVQLAINSAVNHQRWDSLLHLLHQRWVEVLFASPRGLLNLLSTFPRHLLNSSGFLWHALSLLRSVSPLGLTLPVPSPSAGHGHDRSAQQLRTVVEQASRTPDARAITLSVLELMLLRLVGNHQQSIQRARDLRALTATAATSGPVRADLFCYAQIQCGISLQLAGKHAEAQWCFEEVLHVPSSHSHPILSATALGQLALLHAYQGHPTRAELYLAAQENQRRRTGWARRSMRYPAALVRGLLAVHEADVDTLDAALAELPEEPGTHFLWFFHAHLLAWRELLGGEPQRARMQIRKAIAARPPTAQGPLSHEVLSEIDYVIEALWTQNPDARDAQHPLLALSQLRRSQPDSALASLEKTGSSGEDQRWEPLARTLMQIARAPQTPEVTLRRNSSGLSTLQTALVATVPHHEHVGQLLGLKPDALERAERFALLVAPVSGGHPQLTARERELLTHLRQGLSRRRIAEATFRSENTVKSQLRTLYRKLEVADAAGALERARELGY